MHVRIAASLACAIFMAAALPARPGAQAPPPQGPPGADQDGDGNLDPGDRCPDRPSFQSEDGCPRKRDPLRTAVVVRAIDGDSLRVRDLPGEANLRLLGVDAPERGECGAVTASRTLRRLAPPGKRVWFRQDDTQPPQDREGLRAYVATRDGRLMQAVLLRRGWAKVHRPFWYPFKRYRRFVREQRAARDRDRGVWRRCGGDFHRPS